MATGVTLTVTSVAVNGPGGAAGAGVPTPPIPTAPVGGAGGGGGPVPPPMPPVPPGGGAGGGGGGPGRAGPAGPIPPVGTAAGFALHPLTLAVGVTAIAFETLTATIRDLDSLFTEMAANASEYDARVAMSTTLATLRDTFGEMERASRLSEELSSYVTARSEMSVEFKRLTTTLSQVAIPVMTELVETVGMLVSKLNSLMEAEWLKGVLEVWRADLKIHSLRWQAIFIGLGAGSSMKSLENLLDKILKALDNSEGIPDALKDYQEFINGGFMGHLDISGRKPSFRPAGKVL